MDPNPPQPQRHTPRQHPCRLCSHTPLCRLPPLSPPPTPPPQLYVEASVLDGMGGPGSFDRLKATVDVGDIVGAEVGGVVVWEGGEGSGGCVRRGQGAVSAL